MTAIINDPMVTRAIRTIESGRVKTVEVGTIHGELDVMFSDLGDNVTQVEVSYTGSNDIYQVEGSPVEDMTYEEIMAVLDHDYGRDGDGNRIPATLLLMPSPEEWV